MPGNRLAFAIGVGGENELVGILDGPGDVIEDSLAEVVVIMSESDSIATVR